MKKSERARRIRMGIAALPLAIGVWLGGTGCYIEDTCLEGEVTCHGDFIEECVAGRWAFVEDCFDLCGGTCEVEESLGPACFC